MLYHRFEGAGEMLSKAFGGWRVYGCGVLCVESSMAENVVSPGDMVFGLFVFNASHARKAGDAVGKMGGRWMGVVPKETVANIVIKNLSEGENCIKLVAHLSPSFREKQVEEMRLIAEALGGRGVAVRYGFSVEPVDRGCSVVPLTFFRGKTWGSICKRAEEIGSRCFDPLLEIGLQELKEWITAMAYACRLSL